MDDESDEGGEQSAWSWPREVLASERRVVRQRDEHGCGAACAVMLLADRARVVALGEVEDHLLMPTPAEDLAARLNELSDLRWSGGSLQHGLLVEWELLEHLTRRYGTWAALLEPGGFRSVGHWVVVDGVTVDGLVAIRDPVGQVYGMPLGAFAELWEYTVLVVEESGR